MAKVGNRKGSKQNPVSLEEQEAITEKPARDFKIMNGSIKDLYCNYEYEQTGGIGIGRTHKVTGEYIVMDSLVNSFVKFNVHLAMLDDGFKIAGVVVDDIDKFQGHEIACGYSVTGFKIKGVIDNESISFTGTKYSSTAQGYFNVTTPFIPLDGLSHYKWYNELKSATDAARLEVALYHEGNYRVNEEDADEEDGKGKKKKVRQLKITSPEAKAENPEQPADSEGNEPVEEPNMEDFEAARQ